MKKGTSKKLKTVLKWVVFIFIAYKAFFFVAGRLEMKNTIKEKSGVDISFFFKTLENKVFYMPGAFDSDYDWDFTLRVNKADFKSISYQIENSPFYNSIGEAYLGKPLYDSLTTYEVKGFWTGTTEKYEFHPSEEDWAEMTYIEILKKDRTIKVSLNHL